MDQELVYRRLVCRRNRKREQFTQTTCYNGSDLFTDGDKGRQKRVNCAYRVTNMNSGDKCGQCHFRTNFNRKMYESSIHDMEFRSEK